MRGFLPQCVKEAFFNIFLKKATNPKCLGISVNLQMKCQITNQTHGGNNSGSKGYILTFPLTN